MNHRIGVDIGGTFTDLVAVDEAGALVRIAKVLTTPERPAEAVEQGIREVLRAAGLPAAGVAHVVHGTTLVTNALIERKGARTALLTTRGFRDALEIGREHRYDLYDLFLELPTPLVPRHLRFEVDERLLADGSVLTPLDPDEVLRAGRRAARRGRRGGRGLPAAHLSQSGARAGGRRAAARARARDRLSRCRRRWSPEIREYERTSTTLRQRLRAGRRRALPARARAAPARARHRRRSVRHALDRRHRATSRPRAGFPIRLIESGPAAGALAAAHYGALIRLRRPALVRHGRHHRQGLPDRAAASR